MVFEKIIRQNVEQAVSLFKQTNSRANASKLSLNVAERQFDFSRVINCTVRNNKSLVSRQRQLKRRLNSVVADATRLNIELEQSLKELPKISKSLRDKELQKTRILSPIKFRCVCPIKTRVLLALNSEIS